jgi:protein involved in polysaccharide export with SLBB domain
VIGREGSEPAAWGIEAVGGNGLEVVDQANGLRTARQPDHRERTGAENQKEQRESLQYDRRHADIFAEPSWLRKPLRLDKSHRFMY